MDIMCPHCRQQIRSTDEYCPKCGREVEANRRVIPDTFSVPYTHNIPDASSDFRDHCTNDYSSDSSSSYDSGSSSCCDSSSSCSSSD